MIKDAILEELKKGCGEIESIGRSPCSKRNGYCDECEIRIDQHKISTDAERKRIEGIIDKIIKNKIYTVNMREDYEDVVFYVLKELRQQITQEGENK